MQNKMLVTILFLVGSIFLFFDCVLADSSHVLINEIKISGGSGKTTDEFIELYNPTDSPFNIENWKIYKYTKNSTSTGEEISISTVPAPATIPALGYFLLAHTDYLFTTTTSSPDATYSGTSSMSLSSDNTVWLCKNDDSVVDTVGYGGATAYETSAAPDPGIKSIERINFTDTDNNYADFVVTASITPHNSSYVYIPPANQDPLSVINGPTSTSIGTAVEFDGSDSRDPGGSISAYQWSINEEIMASSSIFNYQFATCGDYVVSLSVTDNQGATASSSLTIKVQEEDIVAETDIRIVINELLSDPSASTEHEWIELYNSSTSSADLIGWTLSDSVGVRSSPTGTIAGQGFFIAEFSNVLNNSGDTITLKNPSGEIADQIVYGISSLKSPARGYSLARTIDGGGNFAETTTPTKNSANQINQPVVNQPSSGGGLPYATQPTITITENLTAGAKIIINELLPNPKGADTNDEFIELKNLDSQRINLTGWFLSDASGSKFTIKEGSISLGGFLVFKRSATNLSLNNSGSEEVKLIDPAGAVIDRISYSGKAVEGESFARNLRGAWEWTVKNTPGAENIIEARNLPPSVSVDYISEVEVGETVLFDASDTFDPENDVLSFQWLIGGEKFTGAIIHYIFDRAGKRVVNLQVSDSHNNQVARKITLSVIRNEESEETAESSGNTLTNQSVISKSTASTASAKLYSPVQTVNLAGIKQLEIGDRVKVQGTVAVLPGVFGSQYFYIVDQAGSAGSLQAGVQIYMYKKDFPALAVGDQVAVQGELSQAYGEWRVKTKEKKDIQIIKHGQLADLAVSEIPSVEEETVGQLVKLRGEITELKSTYMYIDDGSGELKVYFKKGAGIDKKNFQLGDFVAVSGIVGKNKDGVQLLPRSTADINKLGNSQELIISAPEQSADDSKNMAETYLTATAGGLTSILIGLLARARGALALGILKKAGKLALIIFKRTPRV